MSVMTRYLVFIALFASQTAFASAAIDDAEVRMARAKDSYYRASRTSKDKDALYNQTIGAARENMNQVLKAEFAKTLKSFGFKDIKDGPPHTPIVRGNYRTDQKRSLAEINGSGNLINPTLTGSGGVPSNVDSYRKDEVIDGNQFKKKLEFPGKGKRNQPGAAAPESLQSPEPLKPSKPEEGKKTSSR